MKCNCMVRNCVFYPGYWFTFGNFQADHFTRGTQGANLCRFSRFANTSWKLPKPAPETVRMPSNNPDRLASNEHRRGMRYSHGRAAGRDLRPGSRVAGFRSATDVK